MSAREIPNNIDAEIYVLGSILINNNIMNAVTGKLDTQDFYYQKHRDVYSAMVTLFKNQQKIEPLSVIEELDRQKHSLGDNPKNFLLELIDSVPSTASAHLYIDLVKEKAVERELINNFQEINEDILQNRLEFNAVLDKAEDCITKVIKKRRTSEFLTIETAAQKVFDQIERYNADSKDIRGLKTGFPTLDRATLGFQKGDLIILAARPSVGKSAFALNLAVNACRSDNVNVAFFSLEMSIEQLMMRLFSYQSYISMSKIQTGNLNPKEMILLGRARQALIKNNIYFDESNSTNIYDIRTKCRQLKQLDKLDFVIIDYLQLVTSDGRGSRQEEVAAISRALKMLAKELDVPILALSQLSRLVESRDEKRPILSDLRESGSIEQDADIVMFLYRPDDAKKDNKSEIKEEVVEAAAAVLDEKVINIELIIAKNRQGALKNIIYQFHPAECRFRESRYTTKRVKVAKTDFEEEKLNENETE